MELSSTPCHLLNSSSALESLLSLTPPSPILSPSQLSTTWTSGNIPILLDNGLPISDIIQHPEYPISKHYTNRAGTSGLGIFQSSSAETVGTFGPTRKTLYRRDSGSWSPLSPAPWTQDNVAVYPINSDYRGSLVGYSTHSISSVGVPASLSSQPGYYSPKHTTLDSEFLLRTSDLDVPLLDNVNSASLPSPLCQPVSLSSIEEIRNTSRWTPPVGNEYLDSEEVLGCMPPSHTFSTLPTPIITLPSPSPSLGTSLFRASPCPRPRLQYPPDHDPPRCYEDGSWMFPTQEISRSTSPRGSSAALAISEECGSDLAPSSSRTTRLCYPIPRQSDANAPVIAFNPAVGRPSATRYAFLPANLSWLKDIIIELLIDQEGFRAVRPTFKLVGYSNQTRSLDPHGNSMDGGVAEFMPVKRQSFNFHYAPFDSPPILRRVTVNSEKSRDYISRQASLNVKSNGVYTVRGTETSVLPLPSPDNAEPRVNHGPEAFKLRWKFDYLVDDRRVEASGRIRDGEKTLTPLTFSCSPVLLHTLQGKKIRLMHLVRKSMVPKLISEKMEPPKLRTPAPLRGSAPLPLTSLKTNVQTTTSMYPAKSQAWNLHRRAQSHVPSRELPSADQVGFLRKPSSRLRPELIQPPTRSREGAENLGDQKSEPNVPRARRRRASSAGERSREALGGQHSQCAQLPAIKMVHDMESHLAKHIIPPSQLSELLSAGTGNCCHSGDPRLIITSVQ